jgi:hypothetical protein
MSGHEDDLTATRAELRREIGPPTDRDHKWQPMVSAGEVRALLDALDAADARDARVAATARADALASVRALIPTVYFEADGSIADEAIPMRELRAATEDPS